MADEEKQPETPQEPSPELPAPEAVAEAPKADAPEASADQSVEETPEDAKPAKAKAKAEAKPAAVPSPLSDVLLFGKFDVSEVEILDAGIARYVDISPIAVPHTGGKHTSKAFGKSKMSIVERLINGMMRTEDFTGKKIKSYRAVEDAFVLIHEKTKRNPLQSLVDAIQNAAPREEVTRLQYGGISVPKAVDVAPARRVDLALRNICKGALESSHKSKKPIGECLADEIIAAAKGDVNCHSISKKEEIERVSASAR
jgi:small subunit ribosomal protein S7